MMNHLQYFNDLDDLEDIIESIFEESDDSDTYNGDDIANEHIALFAEKEQSDIIESSLEMMYEYINDNPRAISLPTFHEDMIDTIFELILIQCEQYSPFEQPIYYEELLHDELNALVSISTDLFYSNHIPRRSLSGTYNKPVYQKDKTVLTAQLEYLKSIPQAAQRTKEWYKTRFNLITASNAYKAFESSSGQNQLIYEKCIEPVVSDKIGSTNVNTPMHWGQKYEPVSVMYYEYIYKSTIGEYGCIPHKTYTFLGASPDGILDDPSSPCYGRMIEIKNIVNREIDGRPKKEYWIQMQLQMENCDLDECDFLETRFKEYDDEKAFMDDGESYLTTNDGDLKGMIMYFSDEHGRALYEYKPIDMDKDMIEQWEETHMDEKEKQGCTWIKNLYWRLDEVSCVLVLRNEKWFQDNVSQLEATWKTILEERVSGCDHRKPNKRVKKTGTDTISTQDTEMCNMMIDKETGKVIVGNENIEPSVISVSEKASMDIKINTPTVQEAQITPEVIRPLRSNSIIDDNNDITYRLASNTP